jgi:hypothetical protein
MSEAENVCRRIVRETQAFYEVHRDALGGRGYKILYGKPLARPPVLFIGFQPGGHGPDNPPDVPIPAEPWPATCEYASEKWTLADRMQKMFGKDVGFLDSCTGLNVIFFRAPNVRSYVADVPRGLRQEIQEFCVVRVREIIAVIDPILVVTIGFEALRILADDDPRCHLLGGRDRMLMKKATIDGRSGVSVLHLSGARMAAADRDQIAQNVLNMVRAKGGA